MPLTLGALPGSTIASAINPQGDILGAYVDPSFFVTHGFLLRKGTYIAIPDLPVPRAFTYMLGMNPKGDIVGWSCCGTPGGFLLSNGTITALDVPQSCGSSCTLAYGINPQGEIVGTYIDSNLNQHGFLLKTY